MNRCPQETSITIFIEGAHSLTVDDVWPDGDAPETPTADDVLNLLERDGLSRGIDDWNLDFRVIIRVEAPNPAHTQTEALLPDLAPPPWVVTTAEAET